MIKGEVIMSNLKEILQATYDEDSGVTKGAFLNLLEYLIEKEEMEDFGEYTFKTKDETDFLYAFHGASFFFSLFDLDESLNRMIKYNYSINEDVKTGLQMARNELREILESRQLSLEMMR